MAEHVVSEALPLSRLLAQLSEGETPPQQPGVSPAEVVAWCERNKYPLLAIAGNAPDWLAADGFQARLAAERELFETQREEYARIRAAWLEQGIPCLMIKSAGNAPSFPYLSDNIDVEVHPEHGIAARDTLRQHGYVELRNIEEPGKYLFRKFHDGRSISAIHVHEAVAWLVGFMDEAALWARSRVSADDPLVNVPSPEDAILINVAHAFYENKRLTFNDVARVRHALRTVGGNPDWAYMESVAASRGWRDGLAFMMLVYSWVEAAIFGNSLVSRDQQARFEALLRPIDRAWRELETVRAQRLVDLPLRLSFLFSKWLYYRKILTDSTQPPLRRARDTVTTLLWGIKLKSRFRPQGGIVIALCGPDGSGKSAHARALADALRLCQVETSELWSRGGSSGLFGAVHHLRQRLAPSKRGAPSEADEHLGRRRQRLSNPVVRGLWAWLVAIDQVATYGLRAYLPARLGRVVVTDRYVYDTVVEMEASLPPEARWSRLAIATLLRLAPAPDMGFVLDVSLETARRRKPDEVWHAGYDAERQRYQRLAEQYGLRLLSTEGAFAESSDELLREAIMAAMRQFETALNALFFCNPSQNNPPDPCWASPGGAIPARPVEQPAPAVGPAR